LINEPFDRRPYALLCEGVGDLRFYKRLFEHRGIGADFTVRVPIINGKYSGGRPQFGRYLSSISVDQAFVDNVKAVLIVSDNDTTPADSFVEVQDQLRVAKAFAVPTAERTVARIKDSPAIVVLMLPMGGTPGNLETLCLEAANSKWPQIKPHLDTFVANVPVNGWTVGKQGKMRMQTMLAATNHKQPDTGFAGHWDQPSEFRVPVDHSCFDDLAAFLSGFATLVA
jgi:hypothetical protein